MEFQISEAEMDTATERQPTLMDHTDYQMDDRVHQTISGMSQEGQESTSALTSRSLAASSMSHPPVSGGQAVDASQSKDDPDEPGSGHASSSVIEDNGEGEKLDESREDERHPAIPMPIVQSDQQEVTDGEDKQTAAQSPPESVATEQHDPVAEDEKTEAQDNSSDTLEVQNDDNGQSSVHETEEDGLAINQVDVDDEGSQDNYSDPAVDSDNSEDTVNAEEGEKVPDTNFDRPKSEKEKKIFLTESDSPENCRDISDGRVDTPNSTEERRRGGEWEEKEVVVSDEDDDCQKQECLSQASRARPLTGSSLHEDITPGHRAVVNTPVSYTTTEVNAESRNTSHVETTREAAFQHAMTLMSSRCESRQQVEEGALFGINDSQYGYKYPHYFYVQQRKPAPMAPLKVWRGYHGNVYFEPIQIASVMGVKGERAGMCTPGSALTRSKSSASRGRAMTATTTRSQALVPVNVPCDKESSPETDTPPIAGSKCSVTVRRGPTTAKSATSSRSVAAINQHHILYLDKQAVINPDNSSMHEELEVMEKQQSTGSLNIQPRSKLTHSFAAGDTGSENGRTRMSRWSGASSAKFDRICRGSVAHKLRRSKSGGLLGSSMSRGSNREDTTPASKQGSVGSSMELMVVGDRFSASSLMSPLLRTQTQFSLSSQRMTVNSPDLYGAFDRLPPLEQVRISLRHLDAHGDGSHDNTVASPYSSGTGLGVVEELKPFIKYSPDVRAQFNRQIKYY